jgi:nucleoside-diphosphate-sugar epimerase
VASYLSNKGVHINVLLTGCTGFVGINATRILVQHGCNVYAIVRNEKKLAELLGNQYFDQVKILRGDLLVDADVQNLKTQLENSLGTLDVVVQIIGGGPLSSNRKFTPEIFDLNYKTTYNLIQILEKADKLRSLSLFVYLSSLAAMGMPNGGDDRIVYNETTGCNPVLPYEKAKLKTEEFLKELTTTSNFKTMILRLPQIYGGPADPLMGMVGLIRRGVFPIVRGRAGTLPLIHVQDAVNAIYVVIQNIDRIEKKYNVNLICEGSYSYNRLVELVRNKFGKGRALSLPYAFMYVAILMLEGAFRIIGKPEPLNRHRLISLTKVRIVDCSKFVNTFKFKFEQNVERFLAC